MSDIISCNKLVETNWKAAAIMAHLLSSESVEKLEITIEEATRSTDEGVKRFIEPAQGTLSRAVAKAAPHRIRQTRIRQIEPA